MPDFHLTILTHPLAYRLVLKGLFFQNRPTGVLECSAIVRSLDLFLYPPTRDSLNNIEDCFCFEETNKKPKSTCGSPIFPHASKISAFRLFMVEMKAIIIASVIIDCVFAFPDQLYPRHHIHLFQ